MRDTVKRAWHTLRAGRPLHEVAVQLACAFGIAAALWFCACAFMLLEPAGTISPEARQSAVTGFRTLSSPNCRDHASYTFSSPLKDSFGLLAVLPRQEGSHG